jgi:streptogramin lyase
VKKLLFPVFLCFSFGWVVLTTSSLLQAQTVTSVSTPLDLGSVNVCARSKTHPAAGCSVTAGAQFNVTAGGTLGIPKVVTQGVPGQDFQLATTTCTGNVATGSSCLVSLVFAPMSPGIRAGAVQITDESGNVLATRLVHGIGLGPQLDFNNGLLTVLGSSNGQLHSGLAVDAAGNIFYGNDDPPAVYKIPASGGAPVAVIALGLNSGYSPEGIALDGAGNLYFTTLNDVVELPAGCEGLTCPIYLGGGFFGPAGIAVDLAGNVYVADSGYNRIAEIPVGCVTSYCVVTVAQGRMDPQAIALDYAGNVFVSDYSGAWTR